MKLCYKFTNGSLNKVRSALCAASQSRGEGPPGVEDAPASAR